MTGLWLRILWSTRCNYYNCNYHYNYHYRGFLLVLAVYLISTSAAENEYENENEYGVDISFPGHHKNVSTNYAWLPHNQLSELYPTPSEYQNMPIQPLGDRQKFYNDMMQGCVDKYKDKDKYKSGTRTHDKGDRCWENERDRIEMALRQPQSMVNYTTMGFQKIKAPKGVWNLVQQFWEKNKDNWKPENWPPGNTYTNHWVSPTYMVSVEDSSLRGGGFQLKQAIWDAAKQTIEDWTGEELTQCSLYGVRVYTEGAVLNTHVDRLPLVSSAIFNVAADLDEPWPLEVIGHDGKAYNITMEPGDMVLYESHSVLHGRPFPLKGRFVANLFVHFEPVGHSLRHHGQAGTPDVSQQYRQALERGTGGHEGDHEGLPPYLLPDSPEVSNYRSRYDQWKAPEADQADSGTGLTPAHTLAATGKTQELMQLLDSQGHLLYATDKNGWTPLHEGARGGHIDVVKALVEKGANLNARTHGGTGGTALYLAQTQHGEESAVYQFLKSMDAIAIGPEL